MRCLTTSGIIFIRPYCRFSFQLRAVFATLMQNCSGEPHHPFHAKQDTLFSHCSHLNESLPNLPLNAYLPLLLFNDHTFPLQQPHLVLAILARITPLALEPTNPSISSDDSMASSIRSKR